jgi:hypothetical protein
MNQSVVVVECRRLKEVVAQYQISKLYISYGLLALSRT